MLFGRASGTLITFIISRTFARELYVPRAGMSSFNDVFRILLKY